MVLQPLTLIYDKVLKWSNLVQPFFIPNGHFVTGDQHRIISVFTIVFVENAIEHGFPLGVISVETANRERRKPLLEFADPVGKSGEGGDNDEGAGDRHGAKVGYEADYLDRFTCEESFESRTM